MSEKVIRYKCSYCNKILITEWGIRNHEQHKCYHNPDNQACFTCGLFIDEQEVGDYGLYFPGTPHCVEENDLWWQDAEGTDWYENRPTRKIECPFYEERDEYPGEYKSFYSGTGGYRLVYLPDEEQKC